MEIVGSEAGSVTKREAEMSPQKWILLIKWAAIGMAILSLIMLIMLLLQ